MSAVAKIMPPVAFDTLVFANKLKAVGLDAKIAEAQAGLLSEIFSEAINDRLATKQDWLEIKYESKEHSDRIDKVEDRLDKVEARLEKVEKRLDRVEARLEKVEERLDRVEERLDKIEMRLDKIESRLDKIEIEISNIPCCIEKLKNDLLIKLGGIVVACTTILGTITAVLSHGH